MSIQPVINKLPAYVQQLQKEGHAVVQSITNNPGSKMGAWTMRGFGLQTEPIGKTLGAMTAEVGKKINKLV